MTQETNPGVAPRTAPSAQSGSPNAGTPAEIALIYERGRTSMAMGYYQHALRIMRSVTRLAPDHAGGWRDYAALLRHAARDAEAAEAGARAIIAPADAWRSARGPQDAAELRRLDAALQEQLAGIREDQRAGWLRERLVENPFDVAALRYLADEENSAGDTIKAGNLLLRALELSPAYLGARAAYAAVLAERRDYMAAYHRVRASSDRCAGRISDTGCCGPIAP